MTKKEYIQTMHSILKSLCEVEGFYDVSCGMIAQSIQEGWNSKLATEHYNFWGMKTGNGYKGNVVIMDNKQKNDKAIYRSYNSMVEGCMGYFDFLKYPRYQPLKKCISDISFLDNIGKCGWNSNVGYGDRCKRHLNTVYNVIDNTCNITYLVDKTYELRVNLYIRKSPNGEKKRVDDITENAKKNSYIDADGYVILRKGTRIICKDVIYVDNQIWLLIPSGYVCAKLNDTIYID